VPEATTPEEARDLISSILQAAWDGFDWSSLPGQTGKAPLFYDNEDAKRPDDPALFGRLVVRHFFGGLASITSGPHKLVRFGGTLFVQLFQPQGTGTLKLDRLAWGLTQAMTNASPAEAGNVRFRDATFRELESDGVYFQVNVQAGFEYDIST